MIIDFSEFLNILLHISLIVLVVVFILVGIKLIKTLIKDWKLKSRGKLMQIEGFFFIKLIEILPFFLSFELTSQFHSWNYRKNW